MEKVVIWVIDSKQNSIFVDIEFFEGQNKYTKKGVFSGPLRRINLENISDYEEIRRILPMENVSQIGKNKIRILKKYVGSICEKWREYAVKSVYFRLEDKKLHHINNFVRCEADENADVLGYGQKNAELIYQPCINEKSKKNNSITIPEAKLYLYSENNKVKSYLNFSYYGIEIPSNINQETFQVSDRIYFRNLQYETSIKEKLIELGGHKGLNNEIAFPSQNFVPQILPALSKTDIMLFWGEEKKHISKAAFSCNISYDIDWFSLSGEIKNRQNSYKISDLLRVAKGRSYIEIDDGILFIPKELRQLADCQTRNGQICIPVKEMAKVNAIAERFQISPDVYLKKFFDSTFSKCEIMPYLKKILKAYQTDGVIWLDSMYQKGFGCCLADDMGLGKTLQTIAFLCSRKKKMNIPVLIVVPKIVLYNWENEIKKFAPQEKYTVIYSKYDFSLEMKKDQIYLTTYDILLNHNEYFKSVHYDVVVLDEAHYIKNYKTKRYRSLQSLDSEFFLALTGTPIENNIEELWALFNMLNPGLLGKHSEFLQKYKNIDANKNEMEYLQKVIRPFILRRTKEQVLKELPGKTEKYVYCEMGEKQRDRYEVLLSAVQNEFKERSSRYTIKDNAFVLTSLLYLREYCTDPRLLPKGVTGSDISDSCKFELFKEYAENVMNENGKLIVFSSFPKALKRMKKWCEQKKWNTYYIDGTVNDRQTIVNQFESEDMGIFFISLKAGGVGLNLVSCQYAIIYDPWWNPAVEEQAADRIYRIGQKKPVFVYHFLVKGTIEEKIYELQMKKKNLVSDILENSMIGEKMSMEDILQLIF